jgi:hypothetical protein
MRAHEMDAIGVEAVVRSVRRLLDRGRCFLSADRGRRRVTFGARGRHSDSMKPAAARLSRRSSSSAFSRHGVGPFARRRDLRAGDCAREKRVVGPGRIAHAHPRIAATVRPQLERAVDDRRVFRMHEDELLSVCQSMYNTPTSSTISSDPSRASDDIAERHRARAPPVNTMTA